MKRLNDRNASITIRLIMAAMLLICLLKMPYSYYQITKIVIFVGGIYLAVVTKNLFRLFYLALVVLFIPFYKYPIHKEQWQVIDVVIAIILIFSTIIKVDEDTK